MPTKDFYKILQVDPAAEPEVIAAAYRRLSLKYHPDTNAAADATAKMQDLNEAYEVLKEPMKRALYDRERRARASTSAQEGSWEADAERWRAASGQAEEGPRTEERRRAEYEQKQREAASAARDQAAELIHAFRAIPRGAKATKVFAREPVYCDRNFYQEHTVTGTGWLDVGFEWIAREVPTVVATWSFLRVAVTVDGRYIDSPKQQSKGPDEVVLPCKGETRFGYLMADSLYIPPLPPGDHTIVWTIGFPRDIDDGWQTYPRGSELVVTSLVHVVKAG